MSSDNALRKASAETDGNGHFTLRLAAASLPMGCGVTTITGAVTAFTTQAPGRATIGMPAASGQVVITDWAQRLVPDRFWLVSGDGRYYDLSWAAHKIGALGEPLVIPYVPAGDWKVVRADSTTALAALGHGMAASLPEAAHFTIEPGRSTNIRIQSSPISAGDVTTRKGEL
jgi:hypothetical protein